MLHARQINHGQSEIWVEANGKELTQRRTLATNEVVNVARRLCSSEAFESFYSGYYRVVGNITTLNVPNLGELVSELRLKPLE